VPAGGQRPGAARLFGAKLLLSVLEAVLSALIFGPECLVGLQRMVLAYSAQVSGKVAWRPQAVVDQEVEEQTGEGRSACQRFLFVLRSVPPGDASPLRCSPARCGSSPPWGW
jgi:hypothetical protein